MPRFADDVSKLKELTARIEAALANTGGGVTLPEGAEVVTVEDFKTLEDEFANITNILPPVA